MTWVRRSAWALRGWLAACVVGVLGALWLSAHAQDTNAAPAAPAAPEAAPAPAAAEGAVTPAEPAAAEPAPAPAAGGTTP